MIAGRAFYVENLKSASLAIIKACRGTPALTSIDLGIQPEQCEMTKYMALHMGRAAFYRAYFGQAKWNQMFTFSFVRNPWSRAVALWHYLTDGGQGLSFEEFVSALKTIHNGNEHKDLGVIRLLHVVGQWHNLSDERGLVVNAVWKVENGLDAGFADLCQQLRVPSKPVSVVNKGTYSRPWRDFFDDKTRRIVGEVYADDISHFGYEFEQHERTQP